MIHMKTVTVRDLRTRFPQVEALLSEGESVAITKHKRVVAVLRAPARHKADKLDFRKHLKEHPLVPGGNEVLQSLLQDREQS